MKDKRPPHERRRFVRVDIYAITHYCCPIRKREINVQSRLSNISKGGAMILTFAEGLPVGAEIEIGFTLPEGKEELVSVKAKVRHTTLHEASPYRTQNLYRSGVEFMLLDPKTERTIDGFISRKLKALRERDRS